jgi:hypothetical protein
VPLKVVPSTVVKKMWKLDYYDPQDVNNQGKYYFPQQMAQQAGLY